jgi:hypothetical protein
MQDGDTIMGEGGQNAPSVSDVAKQLAKQDLGAGASETVSAIIERVTTEAIEDRKKVAKRFLRHAKLAQTGKRGKVPRQKPTGADKGKAQGLEEAPAENDPAADAAVAEDVEEHVGDADGKAKRKRGKRKRGRGGQGAKSGPTDNRQPLLPPKDVLPESRVTTETIGFPIPTTDLTFFYLVSRGKLRWTNVWLHSTE